jgi:F0F1-type ATP synthase assembly protein I
MAAAKKKKYTKIGRSGETIEVEHDDIKKKKNSGWNIPPEYLNLGMYLALPLLIGVFLGQFLDRKLGTKAVFTISFIIFGTISVFYNLFRLYSKDGNKRNSS